MPEFHRVAFASQSAVDLTVKAPQRLAFLSGLLLCAASPLAAKPLSLAPKTPQSSELSASAPAAEQAATPGSAKLGKQLWLFGGGEPICSSVEPDLCEPAKRQAADAYFTKTLALRGKLLRCDDASFKVLNTLPGWPDDAGFSAAFNEQAATRSLQRREQVLDALKSLNRLPRTSSELTQALTPLLAEPLGEDELSLIEDACEVRLTDQQGQSLTMQVYWDGMQPFSRALFEQFIQQAAERKALRSGHTATTHKPTLLLLTSSSYNPFEWVDYYKQVFEFAGANVVWLPLEPAMTRGRCDDLAANRLRFNGQLRRAERYPELAAYQRKLCDNPAALQELVEQADAVFINGGDQSLTMRALTDAQGNWTPLAARLLSRVEHEGIPLAGSSAGTAIQGGRAKNRDGAGGLVMVSSGQSSHALRFGAQALDIDAPICRASRSCNYQTNMPSQEQPAYLAEAALTYHPELGLRLFDLAVTDTHFRERNREGRLLRLLHDSKSAAGVGVDEATVLRADFAPRTPGVNAASSAQLQVYGAGSVWWLDASQAQGELPTQPRLGPARAMQGTWQGLQVARLSPGDQLRIERDARGVYQYQGTVNCQAPQSAATPTATPVAGKVAAPDAGKVAAQQPATHSAEKTSKAHARASHVTKPHAQSAQPAASHAAVVAPPKVAAGKVDATAYNTWQDSSLALTFILNADQALSACSDAQGRWHYLPTPLAVTLELGAIDASR